MKNREENFDKRSWRRTSAPARFSELRRTVGDPRVLLRRPAELDRTYIIPEKFWRQFWPIKLTDEQLLCRNLISYVWIKTNYTKIFNITSHLTREVNPEVRSTLPWVHNFEAGAQSMTKNWQPRKFSFNSLWWPENWRNTKLVKFRVKVRSQKHLSSDFRMGN